MRQREARFNGSSEPIHSDTGGKPATGRGGFKRHNG